MASLDSGFHYFTHHRGALVHPDPVGWLSMAEFVVIQILALSADVVLRNYRDTALYLAFSSSLGGSRIRVSAFERDI